MSHNLDNESHVIESQQTHVASETFVHPDMSLPTDQSETSGRSAEVLGSTGVELFPSDSAQSIQLSDITEASLMELHDKDRITPISAVGIDIKGTNKGPETSDITKLNKEILSNDVWTQSKSSSSKEADFSLIAGPSTLEPTLNYRVSPLSLSASQAISPITVGTSKRKEPRIGQFGVACNRYPEIVTEEYLEETARTKRQRTDVTDTGHRSEDESSITESTKVYQGERVCKECPNNSKGQPSDEEQSGDAVIQKAQKCEHRYSEMSGNSIIASNISETINVTGTIQTSASLGFYQDYMFDEDLMFERDFREYHRVTKKVPSVSISVSNTQSADYPIFHTTLKHENTSSPIDKEFDTLVKYMDPFPVIDLLATDKDFNCASLTHETKNSDNTIQINTTLLNFVREHGKDAYNRLKQYLLQTNQRSLVTLLEMAERKKDTSPLKWVIEHNHEKKPSEDSLIEGFKDDIITYYRDNESNMSLSPLVEEHDVPLIDFYVKPSIKHLEKPHILSKSTDQIKNSKGILEALENKLKDRIYSYRELFCTDDGSPFTKIYLTAPAGMGKSSLSQHITMCWCQSHKPVEQSAEKYKTDDLNAMKEFDVLFLLHLRDFESSIKCNLDDLVIDMCSNLSRRSRYNRDFVETVLHERRCLIILDGLDEWTHPSSCRRKPCVPHNNHPKNCSVLTTSRPWKLGTIGLSSAHIDRHVEISEMDISTSNHLETNAITILNERCPRTSEMSLNDFYKTISSIQDDEIFNTPYIKLQLITLWYDGIPISKSRCEIYCNMIELTLTRGLKKSDLPLIPTPQLDANTTLPKCMKNNALCKQYICLISKVAQMAFFSLFNEEKESRLIFDQDMVLKYLTESEIEFCLKTGLLSQTKDLSLITKICHKMFFQHKSIQEFFAALHISENWENNVTHATSLKICQSLSEILEMSNVFIFLCGMNPRVYSSLFYEYQTVFEQDPSVCSYRYTLDSHKQLDNINFIMLSYQEMQVACLKENVNNENDEVTQISIQDIVIVRATKDESFLQTIITSNSQNIKSLNVHNFMDSKVDLCYASDSIVLNLTFGHNDMIFRMIDLCGLKNSTVFRIPTKFLTTICFENILADNILCSLYNSIAHMIMLTTIRITNIRSGSMAHQITNPYSVLDLSKINQLNQIHLANIFLNKLVLSQHCHLRQLHLAFIPLGQLDHFQTDHLQLLHMEDLNLCQVDLSLASRLQQLHLKNIPLSKLHTNAESLEILILSRLIYSLPHNIFEQMTESIQNAKQIQKVTLKNIQCSDHNKECVGISLIFNQHIQLHTLTLNSINLNELDISQTYQLQELVIKQINLHELNISQNSQLQKLTLESVPLKELDISQNSQLQQLCLSGIPLQTLKLNTDSLQILSIKCTSSDSSCALTHSNLNELLDSVQKAKSLVKLALENIVCSDHTDNCTGVPLVLSQHSHLEKLYLSKIPLKELHLIQTCKLYKLKLKEIFVQQLHLTGLNLSQKRWCPNIILIKVKMPALVLKEMLLFIGNKTASCNIKITQENMTGSALRQVIESTDNLPQPVSVKLKGITISDSEWKEVFCTIRSLSQTVDLELTHITITDLACNDVFSKIGGLTKSINLKLKFP